MVDVNELRQWIAEQIPKTIKEGIIRDVIIFGGGRWNSCIIVVKGVWHKCNCFLR